MALVETPPPLILDNIIGKAAPHYANHCTGLPRIVRTPSPMPVRARQLSRVALRELPTRVLYCDEDMPLVDALERSAASTQWRSDDALVCDSFDECTAADSLVALWG